MGIGDAIVPRLHLLMTEQIHWIDRWQNSICGRRTGTSRMSVADTTSTCSDCSLSPRWVQVVETVLDMQACQRALEHAIVVGIDAEWPPYMTSSGSPCASVVQLACLSVPDAFF